jgi:hypothetical protein
VKEPLSRGHRRIPASAWRMLPNSEQQRLKHTLDIRMTLSEDKLGVTSRPHPLSAKKRFNSHASQIQVSLPSFSCKAYLQSHVSAPGRWQEKHCSGDAIHVKLRARNPTSLQTSPKNLYGNTSDHHMIHTTCKFGNQFLERPARDRVY